MNEDRWMFVLRMLSESLDTINSDHLTDEVERKTVLRVLISQAILVLQTPDLPFSVRVDEEF